MVFEISEPLYTITLDIFTQLVSWFAIQSGLTIFLIIRVIIAILR